LEAPRILLSNGPRRWRRMALGVRSYPDAVCLQFNVRVGVTKKPVVAPSGDKHDYMSWAPYQWADCSSVKNTTALSLADSKEFTHKVSVKSLIFLQCRRRVRMSSGMAKSIPTGSSSTTSSPSSISLMRFCTTRSHLPSRTNRHQSTVRTSVREPYSERSNV
jgi:hypothetical protein